MGTRRLVIWGAGGHALVVADIVRRVGWYDLVGFLDDVSPERHGSTFCHSIILGGRDDLAALHSADEMGVDSIIIAIGDNEARLRLSEDARAVGFHLAAARHPRSTVPNDFMMGAGTVIMAGAVVQPGCRIGENVIINTGATVDHECRIGNGAHIAPGAHLAGNVQIGEEVFVGIGAVVAQDLLVGYKAIVGAGAVVIRDVMYQTTVYGNPARVTA